MHIQEVSNYVQIKFQVKVCKSVSSSMNQFDAHKLDIQIVFTHLHEHEDKA